MWRFWKSKKGKAEDGPKLLGGSKFVRVVYLILGELERGKFIPARVVHLLFYLYGVASGADLGKMGFMRDGVEGLYSVEVDSALGRLSSTNQVELLTGFHYLKGDGVVVRLSDEGLEYLPWVRDLFFTEAAIIRKVVETFHNSGGWKMIFRWYIVCLASLWYGLGKVKEDSSLIPVTCGGWSRIINAIERLERKWA